MSVRHSSVGNVRRGPVIDHAALEQISRAPGPLTPQECMDRARRAAAAVDLSDVDRAGAGDALLLWRNESS